MSALIGWGIYLTGWILTAALTMRVVATRVPHCHGEGSLYSWGYSASSCQRYCTKGCWRADGEMTLRSTLTGGFAALAWPAALMLLFALYLSTRRPVAVANQRRIAELEAELGIGVQR